MEVILILTWCTFSPFKWLVVPWNVLSLQFGSVVSIDCEQIILALKTWILSLAHVLVWCPCEHKNTGNVSKHHLYTKRLWACFRCFLSSKEYLKWSLCEQLRLLRHRETCMLLCLPVIHEKPHQNGNIQLYIHCDPAPYDTSYFFFRGELISFFAAIWLIGWSMSLIQSQYVCIFRHWVRDWPHRSTMAGTLNFYTAKALWIFHFGIDSVESFD